MNEARRHLRAVPTGSPHPADAAREKVDEVDVSTDASTDVSADRPTWASVDWEDLVPRLLLLAMSRLSRMTWRGRRNDVAPKAAEAEDFVNDAIAKTIAGVRVWQEANCSLFQHLAGIVVSDISHAAGAAENRLTLADDGRTDRRGGWPPDREDDRPGQEQQVLWRSEQRRLLGHLDEVDPRLARMAELILVEDVDASADLAARLDCPINEIANLRKRMKRALHIFMLAGEEPKP